jgi:AcrR family transcriptional regulator
MLKAGLRIIAERGLEALTVEAVVNDAGAGRASFAEHFGDRTGFLAILFDSLTHDPSVELEGRLAEIPKGTSHLEAYMAGLAGLYDDPAACIAYLAIAAGAMHDPALRRRLVELLSWYDTIGVNRLARCEGADACTPDELETLALLLDAAEDGLALRKGLDPDSLVAGTALVLLSRLVGAYLAQRAEEARQPARD